MPTIPDLITQAASQGLTLANRDGILRVAGRRGAATPDLLAALRKHKLGILGQLAADSAGITDPIITCHDGLIYRTKCRCGRHPDKAHDAEPILRLENIT